MAGPLWVPDWSNLHSFYGLKEWRSRCSGFWLEEKHTRMNGPQQTACFAKGMHNYTFSLWTVLISRYVTYKWTGGIIIKSLILMYNWTEGNHSFIGKNNRKSNQKSNWKSQPENVPEVRTGSCTGSQNQKLYWKSEPEVVLWKSNPEVILEFIVELKRHSLISLLAVVTP